MARVKQLKATRFLGVRVSEDLAAQLEAKVARSGSTLSREIRLALVKHVRDTP